MNTQVLIADDDPSSRFLLEELIVEWGYEPVRAENGQQAWELMNGDSPPQLAIVDWMMPEVTGPELCRRLKERVDHPFVYVLLLTSKTNKDDVVHGLDMGADDFLSKPVSADELRSRLAVGERIIRYESEMRANERRVRLDVYRAITDLAEARDNETGAHLKRLSIYSGLLAKDLGMPKAFVEDIQTFAPLHDIGKVGIPDSILLAPRKLSKEEFDIMKTHVTLGYQILHGRPTLEMAAEIAHYHHERFNGKGYPEGLSGSDIPISARILALADVYDALRTRRPYKDPWSHEDTAALIRAERGEHFDPTLVDSFFRNEDRIQEIATRYEDL